jgi:hypothetical protein
MLKFPSYAGYFTAVAHTILKSIVSATWSEMPATNISIVSTIPRIPFYMLITLDGLSTVPIATSRMNFSQLMKKY